ncbi:MAG: L-histidine N(alpha)-methyltransferase [Deltaproteobacteria bacterium]|nr:L-histidine N(alpha)-methyltransferase [Deltaproteobacteria bacterium]
MQHSPVHRTLIEDDVLTGLRAPRKRLPCRLLYDSVGAELFEQITTVEEYYPTRVELELLERHLPQIAHQVGPEARVIEPGSGDGRKPRMLLRGLERPSSYVPIDVAHDQLHRWAGSLQTEMPHLDIQPVTADYTQPFTLPSPQHEWKRSLVFFPGSTIGNFEPAEARNFLATLGRIAGDDRLLLLGADATRDPLTLLRAYDDEAGVTAAFNKNILANLNRQRGATFDLDCFEHRAVWNAAASRVEMQLVSTCRQLVRIDGHVIAFSPGEVITTEHCYKHTPEAMQALLSAAGWRTRQVFTSSHQPFRLWLCEAVSGPR